MVSHDLVPLGHALGCLTGATRFATAECRHVGAFATIAEAWRAYRRDAGAGDVGLAHEESSDADSVLLTHDPRRDAVLLWLADHGLPELAAPAAMLVHIVKAHQRFGSEQRALLDAAQDALAAAPAAGALTTALGFDTLDPDHFLQRLVPAVSAIDTLLDHPNFAEHQGHNTILDLPSGPLHHHVSAPPSGCWALNLALLGHGASNMPPLVGQLPRAVFRLDLTLHERAAALIGHWEYTARSCFDRLGQIAPRCARGSEALAGLSRNARARHAWTLIVAVGPLRRIHLARALDLSRAGADIQAHALARAGLVTLAAGGLLQPVSPHYVVRQPATLDDGPLAFATAALDASMANIDRLLNRSSRS